MPRIIKLVKLNELSNAIHPFNIPEGKMWEGFWVKDPKIGEPFVVGYSVQTSPVTEIIDNQTFKTLNSIYRIIDENQIQKPKPFQLRFAKTR